MKATSSTRPLNPAKKAKSSEVALCFRRVVEDYLQETYERFPEFASHLGLSAYESRLSENSPACHEAQGRLVAETLARLEALPEAAFTGDDYLDRRGMLSLLRTHALFEQQLFRWQNNPQCHVNTAIEAVFELLVRNSDHLKRVLPAIETRLAAIPDFLAAGAQCVKAPVPLWTKLAAQACEGGIEFFTGLQKDLLALSPHPQNTKLLLDAASRAFICYTHTIERKKQGAQNGFCIGREAFEFLLRERLGFEQTLPEVEANGFYLIKKLQAALQAEAKKFDEKSLESLLEKARATWVLKRSLLEEYQEITFSLKARLQGLNLVTLPRGESLKVMLVPPFMRHQFPTAAYNQPPAFSKKQEGIFWVNDLSLLQTNAAKARHEIEQHYGLELTAAHEAYPGHHLQFAIQNQHPSKIRRLFAHSIFYEGWTLWCEKMCIEHGLVETPYAKLMQIHDALWRAYRIVIDCGLHSGRLTYQAACKILMDGVGFTRARAQCDINWYTSSPTVPMSYLLGRLEVERLHQHFVLHEGWSLQQFNDWILSHGAIPWRWILDARMRESTSSCYDQV